MKLAREIALDLKRRGRSIGKPALITLTIDELTLESIIAVKLKPVKETFEALVNAAQRIYLDDYRELESANLVARADPHDLLQFHLGKCHDVLTLFKEE